MTLIKDSDLWNLHLYVKAGYHFGEFGRATKGWAIGACEIQAESERLLANARSVLEVESSSTFSRLE